MPEKLLLLNHKENFEQSGQWQQIFWLNRPGSIQNKVSIVGKYLKVKTNVKKMPN